MVVLFHHLNAGPTNGGPSGFALRGNYGFMDFPRGDNREQNNHLF